MARTHLRDELLHDDVEHRARRERQQVRQHRYDDARRDDRQRPANRLHDARQRAEHERLRAPLTVGCERQRDDRALREVLDRDAERQRERRAEREVRAAREPARQHDADRHALRDVVQRHREHELEVLRERALRALGLLAVQVEVRDDVVEQQQEERARPEARDGRQRGVGAERAALFHRGDQETPDRSRDHDARRKARERLLDAVVELTAQQKDTGRAERRAEERDGKSLQDLNRHENPSFSFVSSYYTGKVPKRKWWPAAVRH